MQKMNKKYQKNAYQMKNCFATNTKKKETALYNEDNGVLYALLCKEFFCGILQLKRIIQVNY